MKNTIPIATLDFNANDVENSDVAEICDKIRELDEFIVFEQGHNETYTVAKKI